ncbi:MAG: hypothetical protein R3D67_12015 [Hyphomicrobiaceae bacterium]
MPILTPYVPLEGNFGKRQAIKSALRDAVSPVIDVRTPVSRVRSGLIERAKTLVVA